MIFGEIRADLAKRGTPIGGYDLQIAAIATASDLTLITHNTKEFSRLAISKSKIGKFDFSPNFSINFNKTVKHLSADKFTPRFWHTFCQKIQRALKFLLCVIKEHSFGKMCEIKTKEG